MLLYNPTVEQRIVSCFEIVYICLLGEVVFPGKANCVCAGSAPGARWRKV
jgi:hypothetical protein